MSRALAMMLGGMPQIQEEREPMTEAEIVKAQEDAIDRAEQKLEREKRRLAMMRECLLLLKNSREVARYLELSQLIKDERLGERHAELDPDDCGDPDCPEHGEANKVRG